MLKIDGMDNAIVGVAMVWQDQSQIEVLVYDGQKMIEELIAQSSPKMTEDQAMEYIEFNILCAYLGPDTPIVYFPHYDLGEDE